MNEFLRYKTNVADIYISRFITGIVLTVLCYIIYLIVDKYGMMRDITYDEFVYGDTYDAF